MMRYFLKDILSVTVIYRTQYSASKTLISLNNSAAAINQKLSVLIYNNSPEYQQYEFYFSHLECTTIADVTNPGVSKAYNAAARLAETLAKPFLLITDQDTFFPQNSLSVYVNAINNYSGYKLFTPILSTGGRIYSPHKYYFRRGVHWDGVKPGIYKLKNKAMLNSGILIHRATFFKAGGYNEKIKLYFSDFDFINRIRKIEPWFVVIDVLCLHSLSDIDNVDFHSAVRRFQSYVLGSFYSMSTFTDRLFLSATVGLRASKLSWRYKSPKFLGLFLKQYLKRRND